MSSLSSRNNVSAAPDAPQIPVFPADPSAPRRKVLTLLAAFLGWLFDGFEMGMFPLIGQGMLKDLLGPGAPGDLVTQWFGAIMATFLVGAASGGVLFGWLGDKIGRVRAMGLSIFTYAIFTGLCGFAHNPQEITLLRFIASLGMGGEWSLGVALVNEVWSAKSRAVTAGLIGAAANVGYAIVALLSVVLLSFIAKAQYLLGAIGLPHSVVEHLTANSAWRLLMISGALPALLNFGVLFFVPESEKWKAEHARGSTAHWVHVDLLGVLFGSIAALVIIWAWSPVGVGAIPAIAITLVGLVVALIGYMHPVRKYLQRAGAAGLFKAERSHELIRLMLFGAALSAVALLGTWGSTQWAPKWVVNFAPDPAQQAKEWTLFWLSVGACVGTMIAALAAGQFGRRITYSALCIGSIAGTLLLYQCNHSYTPFFLISTFIAGAMTASFYGFFPLYLPELLPTSVRATGQGFAYNFGRIIAAVGVLQTSTLTKFFGNDFAKTGTVLASIYLIGIVIIWFGPETKDQPLPE